MFARALGKKLATLAKPHVAAADRYELLVYDLTHAGLPFSKLERVADLLLEQARDNGYLTVSPSPSFSQVSILRDSGLVYDAIGPRRALLNR